MSPVTVSANLGSSSMTGSIITGTPFGSINQNYIPKYKEVNEFAKGEFQSKILNDHLASDMMQNFIKRHFKA